MMVGFLFGILVGIIPVVIGAIKQRLGLGIGGFFACAISGLILGLLLAVPVCGFFVWKIVNGASEQATAIHRKCPHCAEEILLDAKVCKHCQRELGA